MTLADEPVKEIYTLADLQEWKKATHDVDPPIRLGVFGDPVAHSLSPQIQNAALRHCQIEMQYACFPDRARKNWKPQLRLLAGIGIYWS